MKKPILCYLGLHKWKYSGDPGTPGTIRTCQKEGCKYAEIHVKVESLGAFSTEEEWDRWTPEEESAK